MAENHTYFVIGFVAQSSVSSDPRFIHFTPGVQFKKASDALGQQVSSQIMLSRNLTTAVQSIRKIYCSHWFIGKVPWDSYKCMENITTAFQLLRILNYWHTVIVSHGYCMVNCAWEKLCHSYTIEICLLDMHPSSQSYSKCTVAQWSQQ